MKKNEILLIESRSSQDIFDDRYEARTLKEILRLQGIGSNHVEVVNKKLLKKALGMGGKEHIQYVHISAHGSPDGIMLTDDVFVDWEEFTTPVLL